MPARVSPRPPLQAPWLPELAGGYLLGYRVTPDRHVPRWGYSFQVARGHGRAGFFVGFLTRAPGWARGPFSAAFDPPECIVFAFIELPERRALFRTAHELLLKYTARPPRWEFREEKGPPLVRRVPLVSFPARDREKYARNFFTETLALLVRSGLPERLARSLD